jgi:hypothetical protein
MSHDPAWMRTTGRLLSGLLQSDEEELVAFARDRLGEEAPDAQGVADVRAILVRLGEALREPSRERLSSVGYARRVLDEWSAEDTDAKPRAAPPERVHGAVLVTEKPVAAEAPSPQGIRLPIPQSGAPSPWVAPKVGDARVEQVAAIAPAKPERRAQATAAMSAVEVKHATLPFGGAPRSAMPMAVGDHEAAQSGETEDLDLESLMATPSTPFGQGAPGARVDPLAATARDASEPEAKVSLTLEHYASFCVERARWPEHRMQICRKYHVAPDGEEALHHHFRGALAQNAELNAQFEELKARAQRRLDIR